MSEREKDMFDDLAALEVPRPEMERAPINVIAKPAQPLRTEPFGMIPLSAAKRFGGLTNVAVHLAYQMALSGGKPVPATVARTGCEKYETRMRALQILESLGFAEIEWRGPGKAPLIKRLF
jgi:hypothetical protein